MPNQPRPTLDELGIKHSTDKASKPRPRWGDEWGQSVAYPLHNYLGKYEVFLSAFRDTPFVLVEIGVGQGASLRMWKEYFPHARIVGIDIRPEVKEYEEERIEIHITNGEGKEAAELIKDKYGAPLIVVDDGSHTFHGQRSQLANIYPLVADGGYYVVEDLSAGMAAYLRERVTLLSMYGNKPKERDKILWPLDTNDRYLATHTDIIAFVSTFSCLLKKSDSYAITDIKDFEEKKYCVAATETLQNAAAQLALSGLAAIAVVDGDQFVGIISLSELERRNLDDLDKTAASVCNKNAVSVSSFEACLPERFAYYPVVDKDGRYLGWRYL
ncbi:MAG: CBS domain-containing protein [Lachnospiraceae bacterium]|nr:CBS domain-containing protein [Lachnospiraceae bacterium]